MNPIRLKTPLEFSKSSHHDRSEFSVRLVSAGQITQADGTPGSIIIPGPVLAQAAEAKLFDGLAVFADHAAVFENPQIKHLVGGTHSSYFERDSVKATIRFYDELDERGNPGLARTMAGVLRMMLDDAADEIPTPDVGISIVFWPDWEQGHEALKIVKKFRKIESADIVFSPAADGRILEALSTESASTLSDARRFELKEAFMPEQTIDIESTSHLIPDEQHKPADGKSEGPADSSASSMFEAWTAAVRSAAVPAILSNSELPVVSQTRLKQRAWRSPEELSQAVEAERQYLAELTQDHVIQMPGSHPRGAGQVSMRTSLDRISVAAEALFAGERPEGDVQPLTGIRELYLLLSGDYELTGVFNPERVMFANVNSSTMAGLVANALNKRVVNLFQQYPQWWSPIVFEENFGNLQDVRWITLGGVGELPTVAEGAAYTELTWDDQTETDAFVKKGGYLGITLEAIDKDDTRRVSAAPRALAQGAWLTLAKSISAIFTDASDVGPDMSDSIALFNASHSNLGSTALSFAAWEATRIAMRKQTELNSSERLGALVAPKYCLVPPDLETTALQVLGSALEPAVANNDINPFAEGVARDALLSSARERVIVVDLWTDTDNWAAIASPDLYPSIGLGYRFGSTPEIFSVASPTAGLMFSNDTLPVKVRFFFAVGPVDWRGMYKHNV